MAVHFYECPVQQSIQPRILLSPVQMASTLDLLPTMLSLMGVEAEEGVTLDGYDMSPILFKRKKVRAAHSGIIWSNIHHTPWTFIHVSKSMD